MPAAPAVLHTARLTLRPFQAADAADLFTLRGDPVAMAHWDWPADRILADTQAIAEAMLNDMRDGLACTWTATTADGAFAGVFDLSELHAPLPDLGFMVLRTLWGRGYGGEGAAALIAEAWRRGHQGVRARIHADNSRSAMLLARLGFEEFSAPRCVEARPGVLVMCRFLRVVRPAVSER